MNEEGDTEGQGMNEERRERRGERSGIILPNIYLSHIYTLLSRMLRFSSFILLSSVLACPILLWIHNAAI